MDTEFLKEQLLSMNRLAMAGLQSGQEVGRMEAAAEIKRLRTALKALLAALQSWDGHIDGCMALNSAYAENACNCGYLKSRAVIQKAEAA